MGVITIEHLLDHMGGLRETGTLASMAGWHLDDIHTSDQMMTLIRQQRGANFSPGADVEYSNTGYILLASIVEAVSEMTFQDFTRTRIFEPLDMRQTHFVKSRADLISGLAGSYSKSNDTDFKPVILENEVYGSTGLYTTTLDLLKWADNFQTRTVGNEQIFALLAARNSASNGEVATLAKGQEMRVYNGLETWSHGGRDGGYRSFLLRVPSENFAVSILSNRADFDTAKMAYALVDAFLADAADYDREEKPKWTSASEEDLHAFAGDYEIYPGSMFSILTDGNALRIGSLGDSFETANVIEQIADREFMLNPSSDISLRFHAPVSGRSPGLDYQIGLHGALPVKRLELGPFDKSALNLNDYVGRYFSEELGVDYWITLEDEVLTVHHLRADSFALSAYQPDVFSGRGNLQKLEFTRGGNGQINGFLASAPLSNNIHFRKR